MRFLVRLSLAAVAAILFPTLAVAQASLNGLVKDTSGAVLPGVTVEASSPALIEKVRSAVTDSTGQYHIENLRPAPTRTPFAPPVSATASVKALELTVTFRPT